MVSGHGQVAERSEVPWRRQTGASGRIHIRGATDFPIETVIAPRFVAGVDWSDHASFWERGYPAVMITDTALYRYPQYHSAGDLPKEVNYPALSRVATGLTHAAIRLSSCSTNV